MKQQLSQVGYIVLVLVVVGVASLFAFFSGGQKLAGANPSQLTPSCTLNDATATSTRSYMSAGTGTSTITCDLRKDGSGVPDLAFLYVYRTASSTASVTDIKVEYSLDYSTSNSNASWYSRHQDLTATTTQVTGFFSKIKDTSWQFASSTISTGASGTLTTDALVLPIEALGHSVRVSLTVPIGAADSTIYAEVVGKKQR